MSDLLKKAQFQFWKYSEGRAIFEWQSFYLLSWWLKRLPKGDGHPVVVFPGFGGTDLSTLPMRRLLTKLGYSTYGWGLGRNLIFDQKREEQMHNLLRNLYKHEGQTVSLIGWSLGGVFARETAKHKPEFVRSVITMGSPIAGDASKSNAKDLFKAINGDPAAREQTRYMNINQPPPVPTTSIYSKTDGIVWWQSSIQHRSPKQLHEIHNQGGKEDQIENIEVPASHLGIGVNPLVMVVLADRLAQAEGQWHPFERSGLRSLVYGDPEQKKCASKLIDSLTLKSAK